MSTMRGAVLPGNSSVEFRDVPIPEPGHGEVLIRTKSSTICGSDIRAIYREHVGSGPEGYQDVIAGHEPCGQIERTGPGCRRFRTGDRVVVYHISGCGVCNDCRRGYMISCTSPEWRRAYGWQRDGGMAPYILAEEKDLVLLPSELSYTDGAQVACGFGTVYEGLEKVGVCGSDAVLVTGLGPVGLATLMLAKALGAKLLIGTDIAGSSAEWYPSRCFIAAATSASICWRKRPSPSCACQTSSRIISFASISSKRSDRTRGRMPPDRRPAATTPLCPPSSGSGPSCSSSTMLEPGERSEL